MALPLLVIWGVWLARNKFLFNDKACNPAITASFSCGFMNAFPQYIRSTRQREALDVELDKTVPWGFFDGATQNNACGGGALLYLTETHFYELVAGLGEGSNNLVELMSLKLLLVFATEKGCRNLNFMGDSMNVINWINGTQQCRNILPSSYCLLNRF